MTCWSCNGENADTNNYCAHCGVSLDPNLEKLGSHIDDRIAAVLDEKLRDQKLVEYEVTGAVVTRLVSWGRALAIFVAAIFAVLGFFGFSEISSVSNFIEVKKREIAQTKEAIDQERDKIRMEVEQVAGVREEAEKLTKKLQGTIVSVLELSDRKLKTLENKILRISEVETGAVSTERLDLFETLLDDIDTLSDEQAIELVKNSPVQSAEYEQLIAIVDPQKLRGQTGLHARDALGMLATFVEKNADDLMTLSDAIKSALSQ